MTTVVRRDVLRGSVWTAHAFELVEDADEALVVACGPGAELLSPTTWTHWLRTGDEEVRARALPNLAAGRWELEPWAWRDTALLSWNPPGTWFSVNAFLDAADHRLSHWYVNFQRPWTRTPIGFDTFDLLLDLVVAPDLSRSRWKDEDEYAQGRRLGVVSDAEHRAVEAARDQALALVAAGGPPFDDLAGWRWSPDRPAPALPAGVLDVRLGGPGRTTRAT
ncbi:DUF402 domain-containing protein [Actinosynnema sp. NPDC059797]